MRLDELEKLLTVFTATFYYRRDLSLDFMPLFNFTTDTNRLRSGRGRIDQELGRFGELGEIQFCEKVMTYQMCSTVALRFRRPFVKRFTLCYLSVVCLPCLSCPVCDVGVFWPNDWTYPDETWQGGRPRLWPHCVTWGLRSLSQKGAQPPIFGPYLLWLNGSVDQDATWYEGRPQPKRQCVRWDPTPLPKGGRAPIFGPCLLWPNVCMDQHKT